MCATDQCHKPGHARVLQHPSHEDDTAQCNKKLLIIIIIIIVITLPMRLTALPT